MISFPARVILCSIVQNSIFKTCKLWSNDNEVHERVTGSRIRSCHRRWTLTSKDETVRRCYASWNHHFQRQRDRSEASRDLAEPLARSGACERNFCFVWGLTSQWSSQDLFFQQKCNHPWGVGSSSGVSMHPLRSELGMACKLPQVLRGFCRQYTDMWR